MESMQSIFPGWETVKVIGRGSFGTVYEIQRDVLGDIEKSALKVISIPQNPGDIEELYSDGYDDESITSTFQSHLKSIVAEYSLMRKMNGSSNIVNCDDVRYIQHDDGIGWDICIKMELLTPITKALPQDIPVEAAIRVGRDLCAALELCKKYGIVHRDIKPQNIFISENGDYKLGDFGIAKTVEKTMGGTKIGTYKYMAPEVYNNQPYGSAADIYSLGLVLYWLLNERRMPFLPLPPEKLKAGMEEEARLRRFRGDALPAPCHGSPELKRIVLNACAYDPWDRYEDASQMRKDLEALLWGEEAAEKKTDEQPVLCPPEEEEQTISAAFAPQAQEEDEKTVSAVWQKNSSLSAKGPKDTPQTQKKPWFAIVCAVLLAVVALLYFGKIICFHTWKDATCTAPAYCTRCGKEQGPSLAHSWTSATCTNPKTCTLCGAAQGGSLAHDWAPATCQTSSYCVSCGSAKGSPLGHTWKPATCTAPQTCSVCGTTNGRALGHAWVEASWAAPKTCHQCQITEGTRTGVSAISLGSEASAALIPGGTVMTTRHWFYESSLIDTSAWKNIVAVSSGHDHIVGLRGDGTVVATGGNDFDQLAVHSWTNVIAISAGGYCTFGVRTDGSVLACGSEDEEKLNVQNWSDIVAVDASQLHTVGLRRDGTVVAVGNNNWGQCNVAEWRNITAISASNTITAGLRANGTVITTTGPYEVDTSDWTDIVDIAAGVTCVAGLKSDGTVVISGRNYASSVDASIRYEINTSGWKDITAIDTNHGTLVGIKFDGTIVATGDNECGEINKILAWNYTLPNP